MCLQNSVKIHLVFSFLVWISFGSGSVLEHFVRNVQCRGMFSTHYHRLAIDYQKDPKVWKWDKMCQKALLWQLYSVNPWYKIFDMVDISWSSYNRVYIVRFCIPKWNFLTKFLQWFKKNPCWLLEQNISLLRHDTSFCTDYGANSFFCRAS